MHTQSLVSLVDHARQIEVALIETNGEVTPEIEAMMAVVDVQLPEKVDGYALIIDRMQSVSRFYQSKALFFSNLADSAEKLADFCKDNLEQAMKNLNVDEIKGFDVRFVLQESPGKVIIEDEDAIDAAYKTVETVTTLDKKRVADDLKRGVEVKGARLENSKYIKRYANNPAASLPKKEKKPRGSKKTVEAVTNA